ncbi:MAG: hypothetical protein ABI461_11395 [Polyangiaceae bacterium]
MGSNLTARELQDSETTMNRIRSLALVAFTFVCAPALFHCSSSNASDDSSSDAGSDATSEGGNCGAASPLACPDILPAVGSVCQQNACGPERSCGYGTCTRVVCTNGIWQGEESVAPCFDPDAGDASSDAGDGGD